MDELNHISHLTLHSSQRSWAAKHAACICTMRVKVGRVAGQIGAGYSIAPLLADHPDLECEREDIMQALRYVRCTASGRNQLSN